MSLIHGNISCCDIKLSLNGLSIQRITVYVHSTIPKCIMTFILLVIQYQSKVLTHLLIFGDVFFFTFIIFYMVDNTFFV